MFKDLKENMNIIKRKWKMSKEVKILGWKVLKLKCKNGINSTVNTGEENISGLEGIATETIQNRAQKEQTKKKLCMGTVISVTASQSNTCVL